MKAIWPPKSLAKREGVGLLDENILRAVGRIMQIKINGENAI